MSDATRTDATLDHTALRTQLERCQELCTSALASVDGLRGERSTFLAQNFEDALQQMELILRILEQDASDVARAQAEAEDGSASFLKRLARGLARRDGQLESTVGVEVDLPDLRRPTTGLQGNTWTFSLPELVGFLAAGRKTGVLWVDGPAENFLLGLVDGQLVHAASSATPEGLRLGEILVELGFLTSRQLERFLGGVEGEERLTGELLLRSGMISEEELHTALSVQVQELFHRLLETRNAVFRFREGMQILVAHHVYLNTTQLILESARVKDELEKNAELTALAQQMANLKPGDEVPPEWATWDEEALSRFERIGEDEEQLAEEDRPDATEARGDDPIGADVERATSLLDEPDADVPTLHAAATAEGEDADDSEGERAA